MTIHRMSEQLANQIAAGEVVERPASVIKECIENSFDAQATDIEVRVEKAGAQFIQIKDNGVGIAYNDLDLAIARHATSKIHRIEDLESLATMGFRGEALASIASVARVHIYTRTHEGDHGWCLKSLGGAVLEKTPHATSQGTRIDISDLFFNTPARRRFMRSERTEWNHIEEIYTKLALSVPCVAMKLYHHDKLLADYPGAADYLDQETRLCAIMGKEWFGHMVPVSVSEASIGVIGWISRPPYVRSHMDKQYLFINGRSIRDHAFAHAVKRAMADLLYQDKHPSWVLYLTIDPMLIDVNIHPTKDKVRFSESSWVYDWIYKTVRSVFRTASTTPPIIPTAKHFVSAITPTRVTKSLLKPPSDTTLWEHFERMPVQTHPDSSHPPEHSSEFNQNIPQQETVSVPIKALVQISGTYVVGLQGEDVWLVDMHAAHERQLMEKLTGQYLKSGLHRDHLIQPLVLTDQGWDYLLEQHQDIVQKYGFDMVYNNQKWKILSHPRGLSVGAVLEVFTQIMHHMHNDLLTVDKESLMYEVLATIACHSAVRSSRVMTSVEMQHFMESLLTIPEVCNHGRPWKWVITPQAMDTFFMRGR